jgi:hypothetical protein
LPAIWTETLLAVVCAIVAAPLLIAGSLGVMRRAGNRRAVGVFVAGASDPLWPLLAIGIGTRGLAAILVVVAAAAAGFLVNVAGGDRWEAGPFVSVGLIVTAALVIWWLFVSLGDLAIVLRTEAPRRSTLSAVGGAAALMLRRPLTVLRIWTIAYVLPGVGVVTVYGLISRRISAAPLLLAVVQQAVLFVRAGCRVQALAQERRLVLETRGRSASEEDQVRPGQDRQREIQQRQDAERPVHADEVQEHRAADGEHLGDREPGADAGMPQPVRDERIPLRQPERGDPEVREDAIEGLRHQEQDDHEVPEPGGAGRRRFDGENGS